MIARANFLALSLVLSLLLPLSRAQSPEGSVPKLEVRISTKQNRIRVGESLTLRAEIPNEGKETVYVGTQLDGPDNALSRLRLDIFANGKIVGGTERSSGDYGRYRDDDSRKPPLATEFSKYWVALPPGHFYGSDKVLPPSEFEGPGKYSIRGTYTSDGFSKAGDNNPLAGYAVELKLMPYQAWTGEVNTNSVSIEVIKGKER